jgi:hypothetical protein
VGVLSQNVVFYEDQLFKHWGKPSQAAQADPGGGSVVPELDLWIDPFPSHLWSDLDVADFTGVLPSPAGEPDIVSPIGGDPLSPMPGMPQEHTPEAPPVIDQESPPADCPLEAPIVEPPTEEELPFGLTPNELAEDIDIPPVDAEPDDSDEGAPVAGIDYAAIAPTGRPVRERRPPQFFSPVAGGKFHGTRGSAQTTTGSAHRIQAPKWGEPTTLKQADASEDAE